MSQENCLIIAGEKSGEDHAMTFLPKIKQERPSCHFYGVGGDRLKKEDVELLYHLKDFSGIGISEVLSKIPFYYRALDHILAEVKSRNTKTAILIDFQGFNLKLAKKLKSMDIKVLYYVAPQAWVWKPWRAKALQQNVHTLFTILPFEKKWFLDRGVSKVKGVVHPLMIEYEKEMGLEIVKDFSLAQGRPLKLLLLPGSRNVEVSKLLPDFLMAVEKLKEKYSVEVGIVKSESVRPEHYEHSNIEFANNWNSTHLKDALGWADMSIAASGTVTLATGLFCVPTVVCYKVSWFTELILKLMVPYKGPASLTNIIHEEMVFPEFIQREVTADNIVSALKNWIDNKENYQQTIEKLKTTKVKLTGDDFSVPHYMSEVIGSENVH